MISCTTNQPKEDDMKIIMTQLISITYLLMALSLPNGIDHMGTQFTEETMKYDALIPQGWYLSEKNNGEYAIIEGELNGDSYDDIALIIEEPIEFKRHLIIATGDETGIFTPKVEAENAILSKYEGGGFGDPLDNLVVDRGSLVLYFFGGSSERWYLDYRFRYQDSGWYLIGATEGSIIEINNAMDNIEEDYNLLTGDYIFEKLENEEIVTSKGKRGVKKLINIEDFDINAEQRQY